MNIQLLLCMQWLLGASMELARKRLNFTPLLCFIKVYTESFIQIVEEEVIDVKVSSWIIWW